jgi:hypothetical protein
MIKRFLRLWPLYVAFVLLSCSPSEEAPKGEPKSKVKEAVKDVVTQDFKLYQGAKDSLKQSEEKHKSELEQIDKESK